jgi:hypothetical protein
MSISSRVGGIIAGTRAVGRPRRVRRGVAAALAALACAAAVGGCTPKLPTLTPVSSGVAIEGGSCDLVLDATNLTPGTQYGVGMYTTGTPVQLGDLTTDSSGSINDGRVTYPSQTFPKVYRNAYVELYTLDSSGQLDAGIVSAKLTISVCLATGLAP